MAMQTAVVIGATGMVGNLVTQQLLNDDAFGKVRVLVRKPLSFTHPKLDVQLVNFDDSEDLKNKLGSGDCIFSCIGTTQQSVQGDKAAYKKIDFDIPVHIAQWGKANGFHSFLIVSSVGANAASSMFYIKLKGEIEQAVSRIGFRSLHIFRPSTITGRRSGNRKAEGLLQFVSKALSLLMFGPLKKYKAINAVIIAKAMIATAKQQATGKFIHEYAGIKRLAVE